MFVEEAVAPGAQRESVAVGVRRKAHVGKQAFHTFLGLRTRSTGSEDWKIKNETNLVRYAFSKLAPQENTDCHGVGSEPHVVAASPEGQGGVGEGGEVIRQESS